MSAKDDGFILLMVDDNPNNLFTLRALISEHLDVEMVDAGSGAEALNKVSHTAVDLILMDIQMPEMDGFETARLIRGWSKTSHIPIVFLTAAYKSDEFRQKGFEVGAADYLTKPIDTPQLISKLKTYLRFIEQERTHNRELRRKTEELTRLNQQLQGEIEERRQAEAEKAKINYRHALILEAAGEGICGVDRDGHTTFINQAGAEMLGYAQHELIGQCQHRLIHYAQADGSPYPIEQCPLHRAISFGETCQVDEDVFWRKDGTAFPVEYAVNPLLEEGRIVGGVMVFSDITERKRVEEAERANLAKSQFIANMSHELRTPLNAIIGYSEILMEDVEELAAEHSISDAEQMLIGDLGKIRNAGKHLLNLVNDVLDISKIEAGKMTLYNEVFDVGQMLDDIFNTTEHLAERRHNHLFVEYKEGIGNLYSDLTKVRQILLNLIGNACKFTEDGEVHLEAARDDSQAPPLMIFKVRDTGIGITPEQQQRLFQIFMQADESTTRKFGGTGLGLAISKRFAEMMGGAIEVNSEVGHGSVFILTLPILEKPQAQELKAAS